MSEISKEWDFLPEYHGKRYVQTEEVYFYACYDDGDHQAHSGLVAGVCEDHVREDVYHNYADPRHVTVHLIPELVAVYKHSDYDGAPEIMLRSEYDEKVARGEL